MTMNRLPCYRLIGRLPVPCSDVLEWARYMERTDRHVAVTLVGDLRVSTAFLAIDHAVFGGPPMLFESMIFGGDDFYQERCSTWDEAERQHEVAVVVATAWLAKAEAAARLLNRDAPT